MHTIEARNVNHALPAGVAWLRQHGVKRPSRAGNVLVSPVPVTTVYQRPTERVLYSPSRDANPFFHLVEAVWMLSGSNDLATLTPYVKRMAEFSDDGGMTQPGAYGYRWRFYFGTDQLNWAVGRLRKDANDRRVVIQMYDPVGDQPKSSDGKDIPCNLTVLPWVNAITGALDMSVFCRSNDVIWGAYGANAVHFSILQEYLARQTGRSVGTLYQISNNYHAYLDVLQDKTFTEGDPYQEGKWFPLEMWGIDYCSQEEFRAALQGNTKLGQPFLRHTVVSMVNAHSIWRETKDLGKTLAHMVWVAADDWREAGIDWLNRRANGSKGADR